MPLSVIAPARAHPSLAHTLTVTTLIQIIATACVLALTALAPQVAPELGIDASWIGYQISAIYAAGMVTSLTAGAFVARFGAVHVEQIALACCVLGFAGLTSGSIALIVLATLIIGVGYGLNNPAASQLLSRVTPPARRNLVFSLKQSGVPLGGVVASMVFPMLEHTLGWRLALACGGVVAAAIWAHLALTHHDEPRASGGSGPVLGGVIAEQRHVWRDPRLRALSILSFLYQAMQLSMSAFAVVALVHDAGWSPIAAGSVAAAMQLAGAVGRVGWGVVADHIGGGFFTLGVVGLISAAGAAALFWIAVLPPLALTALFVVMGAASLGWNGVLLAEIARSASGASVGALTGAVLVYTFIGVMVGPSAFAMLYGVLKGYGPSFLALAILGLVGAAVAFRAHMSLPRM